MPRAKKEFSYSEARDLVSKMDSVQSAVKHSASLQAQIEREITDAAEAYVDDRVAAVLKNVPVSELNRNRNGFRVRALEENGFDTMDKVWRASQYQLSRVYGISDDAAQKIKSAATGYAAQVKDQIKISLSADNRDDFSTRLVKAVYVYRHAVPYIQNCQRRLSENGDRIQRCLTELKPATGALRWAFSMRGARQRASDAYDELSGFAKGEYAKEAVSDSDRISRFMSAGSRAVWQDFSSDSIRFYNVLDTFVPGYMGSGDNPGELSSDLLDEIQREEILTEGLKCELRPYQVLGTKYVLHQERVLLGDEMGLGKTVQAIAAMVTLRNRGATHFIVVCPASVLTNWCREISAHSDLVPVRVHGPDRSRALSQWQKNGGVAVTTYETTQHVSMKYDSLPSLAVVDEAHYIKNPEAKRTVNTKEICRLAERVLFMTGTALENRVEEMLSLIAFLQPDVAESAKPIAFMAAAPEFRSVISPVYLRRKREDVLSELPELIECEEWCTLNRAEKPVYARSVLAKNYNAARRVSWNMDDLGHSSKAARMLELVEEAESDGRKIMIYSFYLDTVHKIYDLLGDRCVGYLDGSVNPAERQEIIDRFEKSDSASVLVAQIQTCGIGLNIQTASVVIICEPQLKPSTEVQAISRVYRMGQTRNVLVYRLLSENTIDEHITNILKGKQLQFDMFADRSELGDRTMEISDDTLEKIVRREADRINSNPRDWGDPGDVTL